jgi:hypothetical protein
MTPKAISSAFALSLSSALLVFGLATELEAAPAALRSMSSLMHLDHARDLSAMPAADVNAVVLNDLHSASTAPAVAPPTTAAREKLDRGAHADASDTGIHCANESD